MDPDLRAKRGFPSLIEIAGAIAAFLPFVVHSSSASWRTENGRVVDFVYRDWLAVAGGGVAFAAGLFALASIGRTEAMQRTLRGLAGVALLGLGVLHALHGFGVVGVDRPPDVTAGPVQEVIETPPPPPSQVTAPPPGTAPPSLDAAPAARSGGADAALPATDAIVPVKWARRVFDRWRADQLDAMLDDVGLTSPADHAGMRRVFETAHDVLGDFGSVTTATVDDADTDRPHVRGRASFDHGIASYDIKLERDANGVTVSGVDLEAPSLATTIQQAITPDTADRAARDVLGDVLAGKIDDASPLLDTRLFANFTDEVRAKFAGIVRGFGKVKSISLTHDDACDAGRCLTYALATTNGTATASFQMYSMFTRWQVSDLDLEPAKR